MGWVGMYWGIRWCYGVSLPRHSEQELMITQIQGILGAVSCVLNAIVLRETRGDVLLLRRAIRLTRETGRRHATAAELQKKDFLTLMKVSLIRPFRASILPWLVFAEIRRIPLHRANRFCPVYVDGICLGDHLFGRNERASCFPTVWVQ